MIKVIRNDLVKCALQSILFDISDNKVILNRLLILGLFGRATCTLWQQPTIATMAARAV